MANESIIKTIYNTLESTEKWENVLRMICRETGASKAIITARIKTTSDVIIPPIAKQVHHSPLLYGLTEKDIDRYIYVYHNHDAWTIIEKENHPTTPYSLAKYLPLEKLKKTKFWEWLEPQGVTDSIVAEIYNNATHWIALNIYYELSDRKVQQNIFAFLRDYLPEMNKAWELGERLKTSDGIMVSGNEIIQRYDHAAILLAPPNRVIDSNRHAVELLDKMELGKIHNKTLRLKDRSVQAWISDQTKTMFDHRKPNSVEQSYSIESKFPEVQYTLSRMSKFDEMLGTGSPVFLLSIYSEQSERNYTFDELINHPKITPKQREVLLHLAHGKKLNETPKLTGTKIDNVRKHWANAKKNLGLHSIKQVGLIYQKSQRS